MLRHQTLPVLPASLGQVLAPLRSCFTAPSYRTFTALVTGMLAQTGPRTVCGMLSAAWPHAGITPGRTGCSPTPAGTPARSEGFWPTWW